MIEHDSGAVWKATGSTDSVACDATAMDAAGPQGMCGTLDRIASFFVIANRMPPLWSRLALTRLSIVRALRLGVQKHMTFKCKIAGILLTLMYSGNSMADYGNTAIQFTCSPNDHGFEMSAVGLANVPELSAARGETDRNAYIDRMERDRQLYIQGGKERDFEFSCETGRGHVLAKMHFFPATSSGNCGLFPGGRLVILVDDHTLVDSVYWDLDCATSVKKLTLSVGRRGHAKVRVWADGVEGQRACGRHSFVMTVRLPVPAAGVLTQESLESQLVHAEAECTESDLN